MKFTATICVCVFFFMISCFEKSTKKIFIKSVDGPKDIRIDWYVHSKLNSYAPDYLQINTYGKKPFFKSFYLTDIHLRNDSLLISLCGSNYNLDASRLKGVKVFIDTVSNSWNDATSRIERLKRRGGEYFGAAFCGCLL